MKIIKLPIPIEYRNETSDKNDILVIIHDLTHRKRLIKPRKPIQCLN
jgi:hypothetical protein